MSINSIHALPGSPRAERGPRVRRLAAALASTSLVLSGVLAVAGGGVSDAAGDLSAAQVTSLKAALAAAVKVPHWEAGGPAISAKGMAGKTVFLLNDSSNQFTTSFNAGVAAAAKALGMKFTTGNGNSVATQDVQAIDNAVTAKVAVIILLAQTPATLASGLVKAKAAGIPVIETFIGDPSLPSAADKALGINADATYCYSCTGKLAAEYEILKTGGKVDSVVQQFAGSPPSDATAAGWKQAIEQYCPKTCSVKYDDVTMGANTVQEIQSGTQVAAQNPKVNAIFPVYDYQMAYMLPELQAANAANRIDLLSENADQAQMQEMASGDAVKVDVGNPVEWDGWAAMDQALRAIMKLAPVVNEKTPVRLFDTANVKSIDLTANPASWYGGANYAQDYEKLWGLG
jgi:ribose transport system substrate-binding protein